MQTRRVMTCRSGLLAVAPADRRESVGRRIATLNGQLTLSKPIAVPRPSPLPAAPMVTDPVGEFRSGAWVL
jgi:hypothetical protein